jgi:hypothetical protein
MSDKRTNDIGFRCLGKGKKPLLPCKLALAPACGELYGLPAMLGLVPVPVLTNLVLVTGRT